MQYVWRIWNRLDKTTKANGSAGIIAAVAWLVATLEFQLTPAGADIQTMQVRRPAAFKLASVEAAVKQPVANFTPTATSSGEAEAPEPASTSEPAIDPAELVLRKKVDMLKKGVSLLAATPSYSAQFSKQEVVNDQLLDEQTMLLKVRHAPFSVYLKWFVGEKGREVMYVDGENEGKMLVRAGGWKGRLGTLTLEPEGSLAMQDARYPVTKAGIMEMARMMLGYHERDLNLKTYSVCQYIPSQDFEGRDCCGFVIEYASREACGEYRKGITLIDKEWNLPLYIRNFAWPQPGSEGAENIDETTLVEAYTFTDIKLASPLPRDTFDVANEEYRFQRN